MFFGVSIRNFYSLSSFKTRDPKGKSCTKHAFLQIELVQSYSCAEDISKEVKKHIDRYLHSGFTFLIAAFVLLVLCLLRLFGIVLVFS